MIYFIIIQEKQIIDVFIDLGDYQSLFSYRIHFQVFVDCDSLTHKIILLIVGFHFATEVYNPTEL
jgi:hypothetical protein